MNPESLLPSLRSSKTEGQANFVNPGLFLYNLGLDADLTPKLKGIVNLNYLHFHHTETLEGFCFSRDSQEHRVGLWGRRCVQAVPE